MTHEASEISVLVLRGMRINLLLIREGSGRLLFRRDFKGGTDDMLSLPSDWVH